MVRFKVVPASSEIATDIRSNVHPVHAVGRALSGFLEGDMNADGTPDLDQPHRAHLELPVLSLKSGNRLEDMEIERRMDVRRYPNLVADVRKLVPAGSGRYRASADLNVRGNTRAVQADVRVRVDGARLVVDAEHTFDMRDFGIDPPRVLMLKMEPAVRVRAHIEAELEPARGS